MMTLRNDRDRILYRIHNVFLKSFEWPVLMISNLSWAQVRNKRWRNTPKVSTVATPALRLGSTTGRQGYCSCHVSGCEPRHRQPCSWLGGGNLTLLPFALSGFRALVSSLAPPRVPASPGRCKATEPTDDALGTSDCEPHTMNLFPL